MLIFLTQWYQHDLVTARDTLVFCLENMWHPLVLGIGSIPYLGYLLVRYWKIQIDKHGTTGFLRRLSLYTVSPLMIGAGLFTLFFHDLRTEGYGYEWDFGTTNGHGKVEESNDDGRIRGVHYFGRWRGETQHNLDILVRNNVEHLVLVPYAYQSHHREPELEFRNRRRGRVERIDSTYRSLSAQATELGLMVIIKPHIWMRSDNGFWRSDIAFGSDEAFATWSKDYSDFILHFAKLSEDIGAPFFCVGTELSQLSKNYPDYWRDLIKEVRRVYSGKLFYAANWHDEYEHITFWDELDLIGIQAYFPLCMHPNPSVEELKTAWKPHANQLRRYSKRMGKPIFFSEIGYKSTHDAAENPWEWVDGPAGLTMKLSTETQANCYRAFFEVFWTEPWFMGALIWQWRANHDEAGGLSNIDFTPQNKPAQNIIAKYFGDQ